MFGFYVACESYRRCLNLMHDYIKQYPEEIIRVIKVRHEITQEDGTVITFVSLQCPEKLMGVRQDIYTENGFREMYQVR